MLVKEYFQDQRDKLVCGCGCGLKAPRKAVEMLYAVRIIMDIPIIVNSSIRCKQHNIDVGGSKNSMHLPWQEREYSTRFECAFDITACSKARHRFYEYKLFSVCQFVGFTGIGFKDNTFLHVDNRTNDKAVWGYPK